MKHSIIHKTIIAAALSLSLTPAVHAGELHENYYLSTSENAFDDVLMDIQDAIVNQGLVIDFNGHPGDMLARTAEAVDVESPLVGSQYFNFCSAKLTHAAVAANPQNLAICPYTVFAYQLKSEADVVYLGFRRPLGAGDESSNKAMADIEALLTDIVDQASQ